MGCEYSRIRLQGFPNCVQSVRITGNGLLVHGLWLMVDGNRANGGESHLSSARFVGRF